MARWGPPRTSLCGTELAHCGNVEEGADVAGRRAGPGHRGSPPEPSAWSSCRPDMVVLAAKVWTAGMAGVVGLVPASGEEHPRHGSETEAQAGLQGGRGARRSREWGEWAVRGCGEPASPPGCSGTCLGGRRRMQLRRLTGILRLTNLTLHKPTRMGTPDPSPSSRCAPGSSPDPTQQDPLP